MHSSKDLQDIEAVGKVDTEDAPDETMEEEGFGDHNSGDDMLAALTPLPTPVQPQPRQAWGATLAFRPGKRSDYSAP